MLRDAILLDVLLTTKAHPKIRRGPLHLLEVDAAKRTRKPIFLRIELSDPNLAVLLR